MSTQFKTVQLGIILVIMLLFLPKCDENKYLYNPPYENSLVTSIKSILPEKEYSLFMAYLESAKSNPKYYECVNELNNSVTNLINAINKIESLKALHKPEEQVQYQMLIPSEIERIRNELNRTFGDIERNGRLAFINSGMGFGYGRLGSLRINLGGAYGGSISGSLQYGDGYETVYDFKHFSRGTFPAYFFSAGAEIGVGLGGDLSGGIDYAHYHDHFFGFKESIEEFSEGVSVGVQISPNIDLKIIAGVEGGIDIGRWISVNCECKDIICMSNPALWGDMTGIAFGVSVEFSIGKSAKASIEFSGAGNYFCYSPITEQKDFLNTNEIFPCLSAGCKMAEDILTFPITELTEDLATINLPSIPAAAIAILYGIASQGLINSNMNGAIIGKVADASTNIPLSGVKIEIYKNTNLIKTVYSGNYGTYEALVPAYNGYKVIFSKTGYLNAEYQNITVVSDENTILETVLQIDENYSGKGTISGKIKNAIDGSGINEAILKLRKGINVTSGQILATTNTNSSGYYSFTNVQAGNYTVEASRSEYNTSFFTVICLGGQTIDNQDATMSPILMTGETRIVLTWGAIPYDLDSHLTGPLSDGTRFHMYYPLKGSGSPWPDIVFLDLDDVTSYGPETTTLYQQIIGVYRFSVHDYSNRLSNSSFELSNSSAQVKVYKSNGLVGVFNVPPNTEGTLWTVFEMTGNTITPINEISYASDPRGIRKAGNMDLELFLNLPNK